VLAADLLAATPLSTWQREGNLHLREQLRFILVGLQTEIDLLQPRTLRVSGFERSGQ
jgi:hypothetical protein